MVVWFVTLAVLGIVAHRAVAAGAAGAQSAVRVGLLRAAPGHRASPSLGAVFLAVTGGEALYADMGHFGRSRSGVAWLVLVCPALLAQLLRPGRAAAARPGRREQSVLSAGAALGCRRW